MSQSASVRRRQRQRRYERNKALADALKEALGCELTGQKYPIGQLEWHHVTNKRWWVSQKYHISHAAFERELAMCMCVSREAHVRLHQKIILPTKRSEPASAP